MAKLLTMMDGFRQQWVHGFLDLCLLRILGRGREYGRGIAAGLAEAGFGEVPGGTLYPALLRLEKQGFIGSSRVPSALGPVRKYYELTRLGREETARRQAEWHSFRDAVNRIIVGLEAKEAEREGLAR